MQREEDADETRGYYPQCTHSHLFSFLFPFFFKLILGLRSSLLFSELTFSSYFSDLMPCLPHPCNGYAWFQLGKPSSPTHTEDKARECVFRVKRAGCVLGLQPGASLGNRPSTGQLASLKCCRKVPKIGCPEEK